MTATRARNKKKQQTLSIYRNDEIYGTAFFLRDKCVSYIHENDGEWREYHDSVLKPFGIKVWHLEELSEKQKYSLDKMVPGIFDE
mgnify:FL=1